MRHIIRGNKYFLLLFIIIAVPALTAVVFEFSRSSDESRISENGEIQPITEDTSVISSEIISEEALAKENSVEDEIENATIETLAEAEEDMSELDVLPENEESAFVDESEYSETEIFSTYNPFAPLPAPPTQERKDNALKIGFITDLHARASFSGNEAVLREIYTKRINYFVEKMNNNFAPRLILVNGDIIEGTKTEDKRGMEELKLVRNLFERTSIRKIWVVGNHDLRSVSKKQWRESLGINYTYDSFKAGDYELFVLDSNFDLENKDIIPGHYYTRGKVSAEQISWLDEQLKKSSKTKIVFIHHVPIWSIANKKDGGLVSNAPELQKVFEDNNVLAVFSGHIEDLYYEKRNRVKYYVLPGLTKHKDYQGSFAEISLKEDNIKVELFFLNEKEEYVSLDLDSIK